MEKDADWFRLVFWDGVTLSYPIPKFHPRIKNFEQYKWLLEKNQVFTTEYITSCIFLNFYSRIVLD